MVTLHRVIPHHVRMSTSAKLSIAEQMRVLQSEADVATWALEHLGLPPEWRDTNEPETGLSLERAIDPNQPLLKQKKQMQMLFGATLDRAEALEA